MNRLEQLTIIETILRNRRKFFTEIRQGIDVMPKIGAMFVSCLIFLAIYGGVMGAAHSPAQAAVNLVKLPLLFLATLAICTPSLHFFNILFGSHQTMQQTLALILTALSTISVLLFSLAPITFFFLISTSQYDFFKLLNVIFFVTAGLLGITFLRQGMEIVTEREDGAEGIQTRKLIFRIWVLLFAFVGSQMAWTLSPFLGDPAQPFILLAQRGGNFYADIINSLSHLLFIR